MGEELEWKFSQVFGERADATELTDADVLSAVSFDDSGDYLATGDKGGRIVIFQRADVQQGTAAAAPAARASPKKKVEYRFFAEFQSHEPEFDYLKSLEIEEKINQIKWCKKSNNSLFLLSTNDKTIKFWKIYEKSVKTFVAPPQVGESLSIPRVTDRQSVVTATPRRVYSNGHAYHINSISPNSDGETFMSTDDLRINLWNYEISNQSFNIVDIKPDNMEELTEVVTAAEFHPTACNHFVYSSSRGMLKLGDMRDSALCDSHAKMFEDKSGAEDKSFFSEIIASLSDVKFSRDGRFLLSRDYLTLKLWDTHMESRPVLTVPMHEHLRSKLCDLYENDCIFDKFECGISGDGSHFLSASYNNFFHIYDRTGGATYIEASKEVPRSTATPSRRQGAAAAAVPAKGLAAKPSARKSKPLPAPVNVDNLDFSKKVLHLAWHPQENVVAVAGLNNLYIYSAL